MVFNSRNDLFYQLNFYDEIGFGSQGTCYLDSKSGNVYKIFNQFLDDIYDDDLIHYSDSEVMRFTHIKNDTFIFPKDVIIVNNEVYGYITDFVRSKNLYRTNPLTVDLDKFISNIGIAYSDIKTLSDRGVVMFDLLYNVLYGDRFYVTDTDEFGFGLKNISYYDYNIKNFNLELYLFLIDGFFDEFISGYDFLKKMYSEEDVDLLYFLKLFRKYLSEYVGKDIKYLSDAKKVLNKRVRKNKYERLL